MTRFFSIDVARLEDPSDLADYFAERGLRAVAMAGLSRVEVGGDGVGIEQVIATLEAWTEARGEPFVPTRIDERCVTLRRPAS